MYLGLQNNGLKRGASNLRQDGMGLMGFQGGNYHRDVKFHEREKYFFKKKWLGKKEACLKQKSDNFKIVLLAFKYSITEG